MTQHARTLPLSATALAYRGTRPWWRKQREDHPGLGSEWPLVNLVAQVGSQFQSKWLPHVARPEPNGTWLQVRHSDLDEVEGMCRCQVFMLPNGTLRRERAATPRQPRIGIQVVGAQSGEQQLLCSARDGGMAGTGVGDIAVVPNVAGLRASVPNESCDEAVNEQGAPCKSSGTRLKQQPSMRDVASAAIYDTNTPCNSLQTRGRLLSSSTSRRLA